MDESARITQKILVSILTGDHKVGDIRINTGLSPKTLATYLELLAKQGLIKVDKKGWKRGKSKPCSITDNGIKWLVNIPLTDTLEVLSKIASQLKRPEYREVFKNVQAKRYSRDTKIIKNYFIERLLKEDKSPIEYPDGLDLTDPDQPFREALKKILALHMYLISEPYQTAEEIECALEKDYILFSPHMTFEFSWHPGAFPELEYQIQKVDNCFRSESEKVKGREEGKNRFKETHLLGLERVDEKFYEEYVKATDKKRHEMLAKIEDEVGWSVGAYLPKLLAGKEEEIKRYMAELKRSSLSRFISFFQNWKADKKEIPLSR